MFTVDHDYKYLGVCHNKISRIKILSVHLNRIQRNSHLNKNEELFLLHISW